MRLSIVLKRAALGAAVVTCAACALLAGCGSDETSPGASDDAAANGDAGALPENDGGKFSDGGCIKQAGPKQGTVAVSRSRPNVTGGKPWATPENARAVDEMFASATLGEGEETEEIRITDFGFRVPTSARITGIVVQLKRQAPQAGVVDGLIGLVYAGERPSSRPKFMSTPWPDTIVGTHHYGYFEEDTWGDDVTANDVMQPDFGVTFFAKRQGDAGADERTANVESILVNVFYCE
ncbi:MAG: hypothetical protein KF819_36720 [Labilithrix sp.]|nr:hypothetical protein [Labilithrix sp.]